MKNLWMKNPRRYTTSKIVYVLLLELAIIADMILALSAYRVLERIIGDLNSLALLAFLVASILGIALYLIDRWQMEYLTRRKDKDG